ncbi:MAG: D-Ala-D-Ala carboxypeptidase family metallohydrolase [Aquiluna sp.]
MSTFLQVNKMSAPILTLTHTTWAKQSPVQSDDLSMDEKARMAPGTYPCLAYGSSMLDGNIVDDHVLVTLNPVRNNLTAIHPSGRNTWHFYRAHCQIDGNLPGNQPYEESLATPLGRVVSVLGQGNVGLLDPIPGCKHFTWAEATRNGERMPASPAIAKNMITIAQALEDVREMLGDASITVTSWYRPPAINRAVGGASQSTHLLGHAVDFQHSVLAPRDVYNRLNGWWGNRGGLAWCDRPGRRFVHIDARGYQARWLY